jgi:Uncharacterized protein conserved in bacteria (DUF2188)
MAENVHVVPIDGGWDVRLEGHRDGSRYATRNEAIRAGRKLANGNRSEHLVHDKDGRIRQRDSYRHDPFPLST